MAEAGKRDVAAGALLVVVGAGLLLESSRYAMGTVGRMGPGYYPTILGVVLVVVGGLIILTRNSGAAEDVADGVDRRGAAGIVGSIVAFIVVATYGGFAPATFACVFVAAMGDRTTTVRGAALLALGATVFGMALFSYALQIPLPLLRWGR